MGKILVNKVTKSINKIEVYYSVSDDISKYFLENRTFFAKYDDDISCVPDSVAIIPFLCDVVPVAWVTDSEIIIDVLDEEFYNSLENIKLGYINMYPSVSFKGSVTAKRLQRNYIHDSQVALFFSGGVDAYSSLIAHIDEKPILVSLWGSDVKLNDIEGWKNVHDAIVNVGKQFSLRTEFVSTNFRNIVNTSALTELIRHTGEEWWHGFQHGVAIIGHIAPLSYVYGVATTYIASSYTADMPHTCASDPTIDNYVKFCGSCIIHDQYDKSRQMKVDSICEYAKKTGIPISLHVCWISSGGKNCCSCEKCYRTILAILAAGGNPNDFGFHVDRKKLKQIEFDIKYSLTFAAITIVFWKEIQQTFIKKFPRGHIYKELDWVYSFNFDEVNCKCQAPVRITQKIHRGLKRILNHLV